MRFIRLALHDPVPDAKTIWLFREQLARAGATEQRNGCSLGLFDTLLRAKGWLAMGGQIIDATVIEARRPRATQAETRSKAAAPRPSGNRHGAPRSSVRRGELSRT
jgi:IS5 family transposase